MCLCLLRLLLWIPLAFQVQLSRLHDRLSSMACLAHRANLPSQLETSMHPNSISSLTRTLPRNPMESSFLTTLNSPTILSSRRTRSNALIVSSRFSIHTVKRLKLISSWTSFAVQLVVIPMAAKSSSLSSTSSIALLLPTTPALIMFTLMSIPSRLPLSLLLFLAPLSWRRRNCGWLKLVILVIPST
ncbi:hypothetical protein F5878DRAFT_621535 [Lentinula raphanica]|uniref:Secreted protein n=1 Tax=Lentinula raphanica TaxID=153919 RepID=A0AA38P7G0_9AGAR|nr:hypothetical protein F5878DRAFT_621535 [Lentinula raphanica]